MKKDKIIINLKNLQIGYKGSRREFPVGPVINLEIPSTEFIGILGPNGIGKSTFLRTLTGVQPALSGEIILNEKNIAGINKLEIARLLAVVLTEPLATKNLNVAELIALGRQPYTNWIGQMKQADREAVNQSITQIGLQELKDKKCFELSDGQLQKVLIARALAQDTDLIILDEPTTHLDLYHKTYIFKKLKFLVDELGKTVLFSSHEIELCIQLCDRIILMLEDEVVLGTSDELIRSGKFNKLFDSELVEFDQESKSFKVKK